LKTGVYVASKIQILMHSLVIISLELFHIRILRTGLCDTNIKLVIKSII
jgi:hypothetical protein